MKKPNVKQQVKKALEAAREKKAEDLNVLEMDKTSPAFTDYFVICSGSNPRQIQAIADEIEERLEKEALRPAHVEGYNQAEWVLLDYVDFVVHIFSESARKFYDLERLWKSARRLNPLDMTPLEAVARKRAARAATATARSTARSSSGRTPRRDRRPAAKKRTRKR
jgi:ribosome-associated protein